VDLDLEYANAPFIPGAEAFPPRWAAAAASFRATALGDLGLPYGPGLRNRLDLFHPEGAPRGTLIWLHGGYWKAFDRSDWSHLAAGALAQGWACAMPSYTLAPEARIGAITREVGQAVTFVAARTAGPIVIAGHSAGGHLAARMACTDAPLAPDVTARIARVVPVSPVAELAPLLQTAMNDILRLDAAEVAGESPARLTPDPRIAVSVWVGGAERPAFLWQARTLSERWACPWYVEPDRHHFNVIDDLADPCSGLMSALLDGL